MRPVGPRPIGGGALGDGAILDSFDHHNPTPDQVERIQRVRDAAKAFAGVILCHCASGADRTAALRKAHEAMMTANKSIVLEPRE